MINWTRYNPIGEEEKQAVQSVLDSGVLSKYIGSWGADFLGGEQVQCFEKEFAQYFDVKHAVSFNSLTSGLISALGAIGISPGDEVIVSPWTMSATATAILVWGGIPIFADIEDTYYGLSPQDVAAKITHKTKAVMVTNVFGHGAKLDELKTICDAHNLHLIEDNAQAPGIAYQNTFCGTWGAIGGFSLNYHKHIHTGEGGVCVTNDDELALKMQLIRNHAEASIVGSPISDLTNMVGYNFRMGEMEAAIGRQQLIKLPRLLKKNIHQANHFIDQVQRSGYITLPAVEASSGHAYYVLPMQVPEGSRPNIIENLNHYHLQGIMPGYVNVHTLPMYKQRIAFGGGYPWNLSETDMATAEAHCPVAEHLHNHTFLGFLISMYDLTTDELDELTNILLKVVDDVCGAS